MQGTWKKVPELLNGIPVGEYDALFDADGRLIATARHDGALAIADITAAAGHESFLTVEQAKAWVENR